jgi:hypothetical protein
LSEFRFLAGEGELGDGTKLPARMLQASHSGMALVVIDPKLLPWSKARPDK